MIGWNALKESNQRKTTSLLFLNFCNVYRQIARSVWKMLRFYKRVKSMLTSGLFLGDGGGWVGIIVVMGKSCLQVFLVLICYSINPIFLTSVFITDFILWWYKVLLLIVRRILRNGAFITNSCAKRNQFEMIGMNMR